MGDPLRLAIIGAGAVTQVAHLPVLKRTKGVEVVALADPDRPKARALADRFGIPDAFEGIEQVLDYESLDALVICSPTHLHEGHILAALAANLHVFCERPLAMNAASAARIVKAAEKKNKVVMVDMNHRYRADAQLVRSFVQSGELGQVDSVRGSWHVFRPSRQQAPWRQRRDQSGGGAILDLGLAMFDLGLWLAGNPTPVRVSATWEKPTRDRGVERSGSAFVVCENGASIFFDVTWHHLGEGERFGMGLRAERGAAPLPGDRGQQPADRAALVTHHLGEPRKNAWLSSHRAEWAHFLAVVAGEAKSTNLAQHVTLHKVMDAIYKSAESGRDVAL
jgi:predicted dehydrogenase